MALYTQKRAVFLIDILLTILDTISSSRHQGNLLTIGEAQVRMYDK